MLRREVIRFLGAAVALPFLPGSADAAIALGEGLHRRIEGEEVPFRTLNAAQQALVTDIAEMIIPETDTPGATSVKVPQFIDLILTEWASDEERTVFLAGLADIDARASAIGEPKFVDLTPPQKTTLMTALDAAPTDKSGAGLAFARLKALTTYGYFTSMPVQMDVLKTRMFFNGYQGNVPFTPAI
jgi:Gluconate 2-dehydrogenase subunit 3